VTRYNVVIVQSVDVSVTA